MADESVQVIVAAFEDERTADQASRQLKRLHSEAGIHLEDVAILRKDAYGTLHLKEAADLGGGKGAVLGGVAGGVIGLLAGPVGLAVGLGALVGGLAAKLHDAGIDDARLRQLGAGLTPGAAAIVAVVDHARAAEVERELAAAGAEVVTQAVDDELAARLREGDAPAAAAPATGDAPASERAAVGDGEERALTAAATPRRHRIAFDLVRLVLIVLAVVALALLWLSPRLQLAVMNLQDRAGTKLLEVAGRWYSKRRRE